MVRRGQGKRKQIRRARKAVQRELDSGSGGYEPPDRSTCIEAEWFYYADENELVRIHTYTWHFGGRLVDFAIVFLASGAAGEVEVERIDCAHGHCHLHSRNGSCEGLVRLDSIDDVQRAYDQTEPITDARTRILLEWEE